MNNFWFLGRDSSAFRLCGYYLSCEEKDGETLTACNMKIFLVPLRKKRFTYRRLTGRFQRPPWRDHLRFPSVEICPWVADELFSKRDTKYFQLFSAGKSFSVFLLNVMKIKTITSLYLLTVMTSSNPLSVNRTLIALHCHSQP